MLENQGVIKTGILGFMEMVNKEGIEKFLHQLYHYNIGISKKINYICKIIQTTTMIEKGFCFSIFYSGSGVVARISNKHVVGI